MMPAHVGSWPLSDMAGRTDDVRCRGQSGLIADIAETTRMTRRGHTRFAI
jgi:hypothetical protein